MTKVFSQWLLVLIAAGLYLAQTLAAAATTQLVSEAAADYFVFKLMGYPDVKVWVM